jgi:hypothetical protein
MDFGYILQLILFAALGMVVVVILVGVALAIPRSKKIKSFRYSKKGDGWITGYKKP